MRFRKTWFPNFDETNAIVGFYPGLNVGMTSHDGEKITNTFHVDSGAELSQAPRELCEQLGLPWEDGELIVLQGISPREECDVLGRIHQVEIYVKEVDRRLVIPVCFAAGETAALLGRDGFFDAFRIEFDKPARTTSFEYLLDEETES